MTTLITLYLTFLFSYTCAQIAHSFRGSSAVVPFLLNITTAIGQIAFFGLSIWAAFLIPWWQVAIMAAIAILTSGIASIPLRSIPLPAIFFLTMGLCYGSIAAALLSIISML